MKIFFRYLGLKSSSRKRDSHSLAVPFVFAHTFHHRFERAPNLCKSKFINYSLLMAIDSILSQIDAEIARLKQVRSLLSSLGSTAVAVAEPAAKKTTAKSAKKKKRVLSPEARNRIADAQRKRWAAAKSKTKRK
ncbi:MAG TPA: hypothetical protein VMW15_06330 [Terracidiphilus sp.]|nr:hypothetical protein [Terracidiphilus sp.]